MITTYITHPDHVRHHMGPEHPESPRRLEAIQTRLQRSGILPQTMQAEAIEADEAQLARVHPVPHLRALERSLPSQGLSPLDGDTLMTPDSLYCARLAAGAVIMGVDRVYRRQSDNVFCAIRPPGHHAEATEAMGFCFYNNVAVAAAHAMAVYAAQRVAILDFDVHQCNGTIDIFGGNSKVLICTSFQSPLYPWRHLDDHHDNVINTPLSAGADGHDFRRDVEARWLPALDAFAPELVLISAGFDAHREDPLADLRFEAADYHWITREAMNIAARHAEGRLVSALEGGYACSALGHSVEAHLRALLGQPMPHCAAA